MIDALVAGLIIGFILLVTHIATLPLQRKILGVDKISKAIDARIDKIMTNDVPHLWTNVEQYIDHRIHTAKDEAIATLLTLPDQPIFHQVINEFGDVLETKLQKVLAEQGAKAAGAVLGQLSGQSKNLSKAAQGVMPPQMQIMETIMKQVPKQYQGLAAQFIAGNPAIQNLINQAVGGAQNSPSGAPLGGGGVI